MFISVCKKIQKFGTLEKALKRAFKKPILRLLKSGIIFFADFFFLKSLVNYLNVLKIWRWRFSFRKSYHQSHIFGQTHYLGANCRLIGKRCFWWKSSGKWVWTLIGTYISKFWLGPTGYPPSCIFFASNFYKNYSSLLVELFLVIFFFNMFRNSWTLMFQRVLVSGCSLKKITDLKIINISTWL